MSCINFKKSLNNVRNPVKTKSFIVKFFFSSIAFIVGVSVKFLSQLLEQTSDINLPFNLGTFNLGSFFSDFSVIAIIGMIVASFSRSYIRAALNTFLLYSGMFTGSHLYFLLFLKDIPNSNYMITWIIFIIVSPLLGIVCWYAKGKGIAAILLSAIIITFMFMQAFSVGIFYIHFKNSIFDLIIWIASIVILYKDIKHSLISIGFSIPIAFIYVFMTTSIQYL